MHVHTMHSMHQKVTLKCQCPGLRPFRRSSERRHWDRPHSTQPSRHVDCQCTITAIKTYASKIVNNTAGLRPFGRHSQCRHWHRPHSTQPSRHACLHQPGKLHLCSAAPLWPLQVQGLVLFTHSGACVSFWAAAPAERLLPHAEGHFGFDGCHRNAQCHRWV